MVLQPLLCLPVSSIVPAMCPPLLLSGMHLPVSWGGLWLKPGIWGQIWFPVPFTTRRSLVSSRNRFSSNVCWVRVNPIGSQTCNICFQWNNHPLHCRGRFGWKWSQVWSSGKTTTKAPGPLCSAHSWCLAGEAWLSVWPCTWWIACLYGISYSGTVFSML